MPLYSTHVYVYRKKKQRNRNRETETEIPTPSPNRYMILLFLPFPLPLPLPLPLRQISDVPCFPFVISSLPSIYPIPSHPAQPKAQTQFSPPPHQKHTCSPVQATNVHFYKIIYECRAHSTQMAHDDFAARLNGSRGCDGRHAIVVLFSPLTPLAPHRLTFSSGSGGGVADRGVFPRAVYFDRFRSRESFPRREVLVGNLDGVMMGGGFMDMCMHVKMCIGCRRARDETVQYSATTNK